MWHLGIWRRIFRPCQIVLAARAVLREDRGPFPHCPLLQMKFLVSVTGHVGCKISYCMLVLCQKLHIWAYDWQIFSRDWSPFGAGETPAPPRSPSPKVESLPPLVSGLLVGRSVGNDREFWQKGKLGWDAPKERCIRWVQSPHGKAKYLGRNGIMQCDE